MQIEIFRVAGIASEQSIAALTAALNQVPGVENVDVSALRSQVTVMFDDGKTGIPQLTSALSNAGFQATVDSNAKIEKGGCCGGCCG